MRLNKFRRGFPGLYLQVENQNGIQSIPFYNVNLLNGFVYKILRKRYIFYPAVVQLQHLVQPDKSPTKDP